MIKKMLQVSFLMATFFLSAQQQEGNRTFDNRFVHTVFFWMKEPSNEVANKQFEVSLRKFLDSSKYAKTKFIGRPPRASRDVVDDTFTYSLVLSFESAAAQRNYQKEEAHLVFIEESQKLWEKVIVYDAIGILE